MEEIVPVAGLPPATPFTDQVTEVFDVLLTVAVNCLLLPATTVAVNGETLIFGNEIVTVALAEARLPELSTAVTVTVEPGTTEGAVKSPLAEIVPTVLFPPVTPLTLHVTEVLLALFTAAVN